MTQCQFCVSFVAIQLFGGAECATTCGWTHSRLMFLHHALFGLMVLFHGGAGSPAGRVGGAKSLESDSEEWSAETKNALKGQDLGGLFDDETLATINGAVKSAEAKAGDYEDAAEVDVGSLDSMEEVESMTSVKSIKEVKSIQEVKHITPIEEAVALAAIKKFRLKNQLGGNGDEAEEEEDEDEDVMERLKESEEEIEEELEKEHGMEELLSDQIAKEDVKLSALEKVKHEHAKHAHELEEQLEELKEQEQDIISAGGNVREEESSEESYEVEEEVESMQAIKSIKEIESLKHIKDIQEIKSIEPVKSIQEVKHIYELTPTQARELKKLVENIDKDYIVSAGHKDDKETISF